MFFPIDLYSHWGELNTNIHKKFDIFGAVTNGPIQDLGDLLLGFPVHLKSICPDHAFIHVKEINTPINICEMSMKSGDLDHADNHGVFIILDQLIEKIEKTVQQLL